MGVGSQAFSAAPDGGVYRIPDLPERDASFAELAARVDNARAAGCTVVVVQGLGFVGAAVAAAIAESSDFAGRAPTFVVGVDLAHENTYWKVGRINEGRTPVDAPDPRLGEATRRAVLERRNLCATTSFGAYALADVIVIDVPLACRLDDRDGAAPISIGLDAFAAAVRTVGRHMRSEALVVVQTTVPVGTCERIVLPILHDELTERGVATRPHVAHAYERVTPGPRYLESIRGSWHTFAAAEGAAAEAREFLSSFIGDGSPLLWQLPDPTSSELAKLLENSYRSVIIALMQEWTLLAERAGVDLFAVVDSIRVRRGTHDNMRLPGFGVGGYCLPKDPLLAQWAANEWFGGDLELTLTMEALRINRDMPLHAVRLLGEVLNGTVRDREVCLCGVTYLPEVADTRNSAGEVFVDALHAMGARVSAHDVSIALWPERPEVPLVRDLEAAVATADAIVLAVAHARYREDFASMVLKMRTTSLAIVDAQNVLTDALARELRQAGHRLIGVGKGHWRTLSYHVTQ